jgi:hypothetical protein
VAGLFAFFNVLLLFFGRARVALLLLLCVCGCAWEWMRARCVAHACMCGVPACVSWRERAACGAWSPNAGCMCACSYCGCGVSRVSDVVRRRASASMSMRGCVRASLLSSLPGRSAVSDPREARPWPGPSGAYAVWL